MAPKKVTTRGKGASAPKKKKTASSAAKGTKKASAPRKKPAATGKRYVRSLYGSEARITLDNGLELNLKPRGQVGDLAPVDADDRADQKYALNKNLLFEEVSAAEAKTILEKQAINAQAPRPGTMDLLRTPNDKPYAQAAPIIEAPFEEQGTVVADIHTDQTQQPRYQEEITRPRGGTPEQVAVPGSVQNPGPQVPADVPPEQAADWLARNSTGDAAAEQVRGGLRASVAPTEREIDVTPRAPVHPDDVGK